MDIGSYEKVINNEILKEYQLIYSRQGLTPRLVDLETELKTDPQIAGRIVSAMFDQTSKINAYLEIRELIQEFVATWVHHHHI